MFLPHWLVPAFFTIVCLVIVIKAKHYWVKGFGVLFGSIFLWSFLTRFLRDTTALVLVFLVAAAIIVLGMWRSRRKARLP